MFQVDLNCDLGESFGQYKIGNDEEILKYVTSVNIACGFHAGDPSVMRKTVESAIEHHVQIGAHPGLPDLVGFGRREMKISPREAYDIVVYQIGALKAVLSTFNHTLKHVKPHGALYNMAAKDSQIAKAVAQAVYDISPSLILYGLSNSELTKAGEMIGLPTAHEVFSDRTYQSDGSLTPRSQDKAVIEDINDSIDQVVQMIKENQVTSLQNVPVRLKAHTICIHGDGKYALSFVKNIKEALEKNNINITSVAEWKERL